MKHYCRNCFYPLPDKAKFCPHCGQRNTDGKMSMKGLLAKLWNSTFHLEGKFLRTAWQLFVPGMVTKEFFKGKQERYPHPLRLFGIVMFFFLLMLNRRLYLDGAQQSGLNFTTDETEDTTGIKLNTETYFKLLEQRTTLEDFRKNYALLPPALINPQTRQAMDSLSVLFARAHGQPGFSLGDTTNDTLRIKTLHRMIVIPAMDIVRYDPEELIRRIGETNAIERVLIRQAIKSFKSPEALGHAFLGSLTWTLLAITLFMAAVLAMLYWRQRRYFVEHFIFLLHFQTGMLLLLTLGMALVSFKIFSPYLYLWLLLLIWLGMYAGLRRYYGQGRGYTLLKWLLFSMLYLVSIALFFVLGLLVVFASY